MPSHIIDTVIQWQAGPSPIYGGIGKCIMMMFKLCENLRCCAAGAAAAVILPDGQGAY